VPVLVNTWLIVLPLPAEAPVIAPTTEGDPHANVAPDTAFDKAILVAAPEQMVWEAGEALATGLGLTFTSTLKFEPVQLAVAGVTMYLIIPTDELLFVSVWAIEVPHAEPQLLKPVVVPPESCEAVHVKLVLPTVEFKDTPVPEPPHIVGDVADPTGTAFTVKEGPVAVPPGFVTVTAPDAAVAGRVAVIKLEELTTKDAAAVPPKATAVAPVKLVPLIVIVVPEHPLDELKLVMVGGVGGQTILKVTLPPVENSGSSRK
jgi:hypothetical protein